MMVRAYEGLDVQQFALLQERAQRFERVGSTMGRIKPMKAKASGEIVHAHCFTSLALRLRYVPFILLPKTLDPKPLNP